jgi:hypothetical protein
MGRALYVAELYDRGDAALTASPLGGSLLGVIERRDGDEVLGYYGVWLTP